MNLFLLMENLKLLVDIEPSLYNAEIISKMPFKGSGNPYFAFWRDLPIDGFYKLAKSSIDISSNNERSEKSLASSKTIFSTDSSIYKLLYYFH